MNYIYIFLFIFYLNKRVVAKELPRTAKMPLIVVSKPYTLIIANEQIDTVCDNSV